MGMVLCLTSNCNNNTDLLQGPNGTICVLPGIKIIHRLTASTYGNGFKFHLEL